MIMIALTMGAAAIACFAETRTVEVSSHLVHLEADAPDGADVSWESREPEELEYSIHDVAGGKSLATFCMCGLPRVVIVSDVIDWDARKRTKIKWVVTSNQPPKPDDPDDPDVPVPPTGFRALIRSALKSIGDPPSKSKVAKAYSDVAEEANVRRDLWTPALMLDEAKNRTVSSLSPTELRTWGPFWPKMSEAIRSLGLEQNDTNGFIIAFRDIAAALNE